MKTYTVHRASDQFDFQHSAEDEAWAGSVPESLVDCVTGEKTSLATRFRVLWDTEYLYARFLVEDREIIASHTERDAPLYEEDVVEIFLSPTGSRHYYYEFNFSPKGGIFDALVLNDDGRAGHGRGTLDAFIEWNASELKIQTELHDTDWWVVAAAIPFRQLHLAEHRPPEPGEIWRANFCRIEYGLPETEYSAWNPPELVDFHTSERFGQLIFV